MKTILQKNWLPYIEKNSLMDGKDVCGSQSEMYVCATECVVYHVQQQLVYL